MDQPFVTGAEQAVAERPSPVDEQPRDWTWRRWHLWLLIMGLLARVGFCLTTSRQVALAEVDGREHLAYAQSLLALKWDDYPRYFNCIRPPLYPMFLTPFVALSDHYVWHIQLAQVGLGILQALILARIAGRWAGQRAGDYAFAFALFHPFLIFYNAFLLTETLFITLLWAGIACLQRFEGEQAQNALRWLAGAALALGLACLTRAALQPFLVFAVCWIGYSSRVNSWSKVWRRMAYFTILVSLLLLPFMLLNQWAHGDFSLSPYCGQRTLALGNSPEYFSLYEARTKDEYYARLNHINELLSVKDGKPAGEWMEEVRAFLRERRGDWLRLQWHKFKHFWTPWLNPLIFPASTFLLSVLSATPLFILAVAELWRRRSNRDAFLSLLLGLIATGYLVGGILFQVQVRYRIPFVDVAFIILAASFLGQLTINLGFQTIHQRPARRFDVHCD
jgi:4-amino-4-deoxy-L-arabinose transferase-like glycosyltransferase